MGGISNISNTYTQMPFLSASRPAYGLSEGQFVNPKKTTLPSDGSYVGMPFSTDQYELAQKIAEGNIFIDPNKTNQMHQARAIDPSKGALWGEGPKLAEYNGTGQLQPESRVEGEQGDNVYYMA